ncbi:MAG TPA: DUF3574 domain-containing protein [Methylocella sp.]|nr:DUF3574 domain-containing protein [Methylocella sp.]
MRAAVVSPFLLIVAAGLIGAYGGRMSAPGSAALVCRPPARPLAKIELMFGSQRKNMSPISDEEWGAFLAAEGTPRFPAGLTVLTGYGQWRDASGILVKETSRLLLIWYAPEAGGDTRIEAIRTAYKTRFGQDSVLRVDGAPACVSF